MSALAEALVAAQRRALTAMEKRYAAGLLEHEDARMLMDSFGCTDAVDQDRLLAALGVIRSYGAELPAEPNGALKPRTDEPATDAQWTLIRKLVTEKHATAPDGPLTKAQAHEVIDTLKAGTYDCARCADSPADPVYLDAETEPEYRPLAKDGSAEE